MTFLTYMIWDIAKIIIIIRIGVEKMPDISTIFRLLRMLQADMVLEPAVG